MLFSFSTVGTVQNKIFGGIRPRRSEQDLLP
jgi:hypothetical protein